jgi:cytochrome c biogenesis protein CcmG, thiol:disulfide interchange protein DsbE
MAELHDTHDTHEQPSQMPSPSSSVVPSSSGQPQASSRRQFTLGRVITIVLVVATIAVLLRALLTPSVPSSHGAGTSATPGSAAPLVNHYAPEATLLDLHNNRVALSSWRGKVVVLNFWYVACAPCQYEMPALQQAYDAQYSKGLVVVGVNTSDDAVSITQFVKALGITYPILRDIGQRTTIEYRVADTPTSFFIDRHGVIRYKVIGPLDKATLNQETAALLSQV